MTGADGSFRRYLRAAREALVSPQNFPYSVVAPVLQSIPFLSEKLRYNLLLVERPNYAYGVQRAAQLASALNLPGVTVIEFGVASGNGLLALEAHADVFARSYGLEIDVLGFDTGKGLPAPMDYRDIPYEWSSGSYRMDESRLRERLRRAQLVLGDVANTVPEVLAKTLRFPIGFIAFDLDYYSSTMSAFRVFDEGDMTHVLPRVHAYFDDVVTVEWLGVPAAIRDFNRASEKRKIGRIEVLRDFVPGYPAWADRFYEVHFFHHSKYSVLLTSTEEHQLPLRSGQT